MPLPDDADQRLERLVDLVVRLASGDLGARLEPSPAADRIDAVVVGLGMLAEELQWLNGDLERRVTERTRQLEEAHRQLERLALYDPLTGLANRTLLGDRLARAVAGAERGGAPPAVLVLDLDGFKSVNDTFGHAVGDQLLVEIAHRLRAVVRDVDTVARLGGDEFAVVVHEAGAEEALDVAERIHVALRASVQVGEHSCWVDASVGVRLAARGATGGVLLRDADTAMYAAKARGRGGVQVYQHAMHAAALSRVSLAEELRTAISAGEFVLHYQPIVDLTTGRPSGVEALVRWPHPVRGLLAPDEFIPVAEDTGLVVALDRWVLDTALAQLARWRAATPGSGGFGLHVNVSPIELRSPGFAGAVVACLARHGIDPAGLILEVTETRLVGEDAQTLQTTEDLRAAGVGLAIDDFGVGYSSLGYLRRLSVEVVKIDRSLITGLDTDPRQHRVAAAILAVVDAFGLVTVAEGVETTAQAEQLRLLGCRYGQGFLWGAPRPAGAIPDVLRASVG